MTYKQKSKVGIIGTGFIARGLILAINNLEDLEISNILTRRDVSELSDLYPYTSAVNELMDNSDVVVECTGDPIYATDVIAQTMEANLPVITMNAELHVTSGTFLSSKGYLTEAEGDQPGALAALNRDILEMGFKPLVYGNLKGFLNRNPTFDEMEYWAKKQGISLSMVTGFTDGTKLQFEQVLVANGLGASIAKQGMIGLITDDVDESANLLAQQAKQLGCPISDYLLCSPTAKKKFPAGIFITAEHDSNQAPSLEYLKMGSGPFYTLVRNYHLCHLEIPKTIRHVLQGGNVLLDNSLNPTASVATIAKRDLMAGEKLGKFEVRGEAIEIQSHPNHLPYGLTKNAVLRRSVKTGDMINLDDIEVNETLAYKAWMHTLEIINCQ